MEMEKLSEEAVWFQYDEVMLVFQLFIKGPRRTLRRAVSQFFGYVSEPPFLHLDCPTRVKSTVEQH